MPKSLRKKLGRNEIHKKLANTHKEAIVKKSQVEAEVQRMFGVELNQSSEAEKLLASYESDPNFKGIKSLSEIPSSDKETLINIYNDPYEKPEHAEIRKALEGKSTWQQWINRRQRTEQIAKNTINAWKTNLKGLANWKGSDYLQDLTKKEALEYRDFLLNQGYETAGIKNRIGSLSGFWNWGIENEIIKTNIWLGLKKRLGDSERKPLPTREVFDQASEKASSTSAQRKKKDYAFLIQRYTACRGGEANGLRHCDIDLEERTITFEPWEKIVKYQKIRGGIRSERMNRRLKSAKDKRTIPISTKLYEAIKDIHLINDCDDPIWPLRYKATNDGWGGHHLGEYTKKYGFPSHDLRRFGVTLLNLAGVSPYIMYAITRHKIEGMSDINLLYTRPSIDDLREIIEYLN